MPSADAILETSAAIANHWRWLAVAWHVAFGVTAIYVVTTRRLPQGSVALLFALPAASVSVLSWDAGNPFNGVVFMLLALLLAGAAATMADGPLSADTPILNRATGLALVALGVAYPHFLAADAWWMYLYAAPFGLLPCPTLAVTAGASLIFGMFGSRQWGAIVALATLTYGVIGVAVLHVWIDALLIAGGLLLLRDVLAVTRTSSSVRGGSAVVQEHRGECHGLLRDSPHRGVRRPESSHFRLLS